MRPSETGSKDLSHDQRNHLALPQQPATDAFGKLFCTGGEIAVRDDNRGVTSIEFRTSEHLLNRRVPDVLAVAFALNSNPLSLARRHEIDSLVAALFRRLDRIAEVLEYVLDEG